MIENEFIFNNSNWTDNSFTNFISHDLLKKYHNICENATKEKGEELIKIRTKQFVNAKIWVEIHQYDNKYLINSENDLAIAYLYNECYDQCIEHLNGALERIKLKSLNNNDKKLFIEIYTNLGIAHIEIEQYNDANDYLDLAKEKCEGYFSEENEQMAEIYNLKGKIEKKWIKYKSALEYLKWTKKIYKDLDNIKKFESYSSFIYNYSEVYESLKKYNKSIKYLKKLLDFDYNNKTEYIKIKIKIIELYSKNYDEENVQFYLNEIKETYEKEKIWDKIFIKPLKKLVFIYSKQKTYQKALDVIKYLEEIEISIYGDKHMKYAKTLLLKSSLMYNLKRKFNAIEVLKDAIFIFELEGDKSNLNSAKEKLKAIENN